MGGNRRCIIRVMPGQPGSAHRPVRVASNPGSVLNDSCLTPAQVRCSRLYSAGHGPPSSFPRSRANQARIQTKETHTGGRERKAWVACTRAGRTKEENGRDAAGGAWAPAGRYAAGPPGYRDTGSWVTPAPQTRDRSRRTDCPCRICGPAQRESGGSARRRAARAAGLRTEWVGSSLLKEAAAARIRRFLKFHFL